MRFASIFARWLFVLCIPLLVVTASIALAVNSAWFYRSGFVKYGVSQVTGISSSELGKAADGLIAYFNSGEEYINVTVVKDGKPLALFNRREIGHLKDVKDLIRLDYRVGLGTALYVLAYVLAGVVLLKKKRQTARHLVTGSVLTLALMAAVGLGALVDFEGLFLQFHLLSFTNDLWQLDPATDYLIMLFPQGFWFDAALFCALSATAMAVVAGGAGLWYLRHSAGSQQS